MEDSHSGVGDADLAQERGTGLPRTTASRVQVTAELAVPLGAGDREQRVTSGFCPEPWGLGVMWGVGRGFGCGG